MKSLRNRIDVRLVNYVPFDDCIAFLRVIPIIPDAPLAVLLYLYSRA